MIHLLDKKRRFSEKDLEILTMFANHAAIAVENTRLYEEIQNENSKRKKQEEARRESEERFRFAVGQIPGTLWTTDDQLIFTLSEGGGLGEIGLSPGQVVGMSLYEFFNTEEEILPIRMHRRALLGQSVSYEYIHGESVFSTNLEPYRDADGRIVGVLGIA
ncbi:MAG: hypothetical protein JSV89_10750, partial [Spirochaetaceae bacterium]